MADLPLFHPEDLEDYKHLQNGGAPKREAHVELLIRLAGVMFGAILVVSGAAAGWLLWGRDDPWTPLGPFPTQEAGRIEADGTFTPLENPIYSVHGVVPIRGEKCRHGTEGVQVRGGLAWRGVDPSGFVSNELIFPSVSFSNGCNVSVFENVPPQEVVDLVCARGDSTWHVTGYEVPTGDVLNIETEAIEARSGLRLGWETQTFTLTCDR